MQMKQLTALVVGPFALLVSGSAAGTLLVARRAERALPGARTDRALPGG